MRDTSNIRWWSRLWLQWPLWQPLSLRLAQRVNAAAVTVGLRRAPAAVRLQTGHAGSSAYLRGRHAAAGGAIGPVAVAPGAERIDMALLMVVVALVMFGTVMVYSASISLSDSPKYGVTTYHFVWRHVKALTMGLAAAAVVVSVPLARWQRLAPWIFLTALLLLVLVLVPGIGKRVNGAYRWIPLGFVNLQPSELMKVAVLLYVADYTVRRQDRIHDVRKGFLPMAGVIVIIAALMLMQPDLGGLGVIALISLGVLFLGGINARLFGLAGLVLAATFAAVIALYAEKRARILAFIDVWDPTIADRKGYQLVHSLIAFGRGEWFGVGLGASVEKLHYLPEAHTDFILAVIAEELGLVGVLTLLLLFYWLVKRAFEIGRQAVALDRTFAGLVAQGVGIWIGIQVVVNVGVATGSLPTKGLTLPLISFGGSALLSTLIGLALLLRVDLENRRLMRGGRV